MIGHYLLTLYRALNRHRLYAALNVLGLAVGIAVFLVLWLDVRFETGFERWIPGARQIYLVETKAEGFGNLGSTMGATLDELRADYPQLVGTRFWTQGATVGEGSRITSAQVDIVDPDFFKVFDLPLVSGDKTAIFRAPNDLVLTQGEARKYFGATNPLGQRLTITFDGAARVYRVAGVLKDAPRNTDFQFDFLVPLTPDMTAKDPIWRHWGNVELGTFLHIPTPASAEALQADLDSFVDRHAARDVTPAPPHKTLSLQLKPMVALHLESPKDAATVAAMGGVGLLTLLLATLNYVNLATARGALRAREVAVRKVLGATGRALLGQFMLEAVATAVLAAAIGLALCELALPLVNAAGGLALGINYLGADSILIVVLATAVLIGLVAGTYPALVLARFQAAQVLASARAPTGGRGGARLREILVGVQFAIAVAFMIATGVILAETHYVRSADAGFDRDGLIVVNAFNDGNLTDSQRANLIAAWRTLPGVMGVTASTVAPGNGESVTATNIKRPGMAGNGPVIHVVRTRPDFFTVYGARLKAGRFVDLNHGGDDQPPRRPPPAPGARPSPPTAPPPQNVVLNVKGMAPLGFHDARDAVGKPLLLDERNGTSTALTIVGVTGDIRFSSPRDPVPATIYMLQTRDFRYDIAGVRYAGADPYALIARMQAAWKAIAPGVPFEAQTVEANLQKYYRDDDQHGRLFTIGAALAVAIGCVGLYGLASFTTARRVREIGIRKTLGASTADVLGLIVGQFLRPVLLANLIAWPLAWLAMRAWLQGFDQRIALGPGYFLAATALTLVIALATVAGQAFAVARAEPAKALRDE